MSLTKDIASGLHDADLEEISEAIRLRLSKTRRERAKTIKASLKPGDEVTIGPNVQPKAAAGKRATFIEALPRGGCVVLAFEEDVHTWKAGDHVTVPASVLEVEDDETS